MLPYWEDVFASYFSKIKNVLYPKNIPNKYAVYLLSTYHIYGALFIMNGVFLPPSLLPFYLFYLGLIILSYFLFDNYCFITLLSNKLSGKKESALKIRMQTAQNLLIIFIYLAIVFILFPQYSFFEQLRRYVHSFWLSAFHTWAKGVVTACPSVLVSMAARLCFAVWRFRAFFWRATIFHRKILS